MTLSPNARALARLCARSARVFGAGIVVAATLLAGCTGGSFGAPKITQQPKDTTAFETQRAVFSIGAEGAAPLSFQWKRNGVAITGATEPTYTTPALTAADSGAKFSITITNGSGSATSTEATLTVQGPPAITTQPVAVSVNVGATAAFSVTATGNSLAYQWLKDDVVISGATGATYTTAATVAADDGAYFSVAVSNGAGIVISTPVLLTVASVPAVTIQPVSQVAAEGDAVLFGVYATGGNLAYQWKRNGVNIAGATARRYSMAAASAADSGATFSVAVTNTLGTATSTAATLTVAPRTVVGMPTVVAQLDTSRSGVAADSFTVARKSDGTVWSWGYNGEGQRGDGTTATATTDTPTKITLPTGAVAAELAVGGHHALVRLANGDVYAWGRNNYGQLGQGDTAARATPIKVTLPRPAIAIAAGRDHSLVVLDDGSVCAWGLDDGGQLGIANRAQSPSPANVAGITGVARVAAGNAHSLALRTDGSVWAWGTNASGQVGDGTLVVRRLPVDTGLRGVAAIAAGADASFAFTSRRMAYAWGENSAGQLGRGTATTADISTPAGLMLDVVGASASDVHSLLAMSDGTVQGTGSNASGEVGDGTTTARTVYTAATVASTVTAVAAGGNAHSVALRADGQLYSWGNNAAKQLGNASVSASTPTPTLVPSFDAIP